MNVFRIFFFLSHHALSLKAHLDCVLFKIILFLILFVFLFVTVLGLHCFVQAFSRCGEGGFFSLQCTGFSLQWLLLLQSACSRCAGFSSWGTQVQ